MGLFIPALWFEDKEIKAATHVLINLIQASLKCGSVIQLLLIDKPLTYQ